MVLRHLKQPKDTLELLTKLMSPTRESNSITLIIVEFGTEGNHHHSHTRCHHHQDNGQAKDDDDSQQRTQEIVNQYGVFTHGFDPVQLQRACKIWG